ncbi:MAG: hypothetical protein IJ042_00525 [Butyricicoccus sp.]|nr:hypothetical protein [Butyricicoccus sp.]
MPYPRGKDDFNGRFSWYKWSAPFFETPAEVYRYLATLGLRGKRLREVRVIGSAFHVGDADRGILYHRVLQAGIEPDEAFPASYPYLEKILVPQRVHLCEPLQFVFEDETTLEFQPITGGARIGVNTIPLTITDGLNHADLDARRFFAEVCGCELTDFRVREVETTTRSFWRVDGEPSTRDQSAYQIEWSFEGSNSLVLFWDWEGWFRAELNRYMQTCLVPYVRVTEAKGQNEQIAIINGRDSGGVYWIFPISLDDETVEERMPVTSGYGIAIDEGDVREFLSFFLVQWFDPSIQERDEWEENRFDSYGHNYYTFESIRRMLEEIRAASWLLQEEYDHPVLDDLKSGFTWYLYTSKNWQEVTEAEKNELRRNRVPLAVDFYERFCARMEEMMTLPGRNAISFAGP